MTTSNNNTRCENEKPILEETLYSEIMDTNRGLLNITNLLVDIGITLTGKGRDYAEIDSSMALKECVDCNRNLTNEILAEVRDLARFIGADSKF